MAPWSNVTSVLEAAWKKYTGEDRMRRKNKNGVLRETKYLCFSIKFTAGAGLSWTMATGIKMYTVIRT